MLRGANERTRPPRPGSFILFFSSLCSLCLCGSTLSASPVRLPDGSEIQQVDFERHVAGLLGKLGCNAGACHGSFQGKGGFRLSLFGYDPEKDFLALTRDTLGRRVQAGNPDDSLLLLKATGQLTHGGGKRLDRNS